MASAINQALDLVVEEVDLTVEEILVELAKESQGVQIALTGVSRRMALVVEWEVVRVVVVAWEIRMALMNRF